MHWNYLFDIETLGIESTAVILSIALLPFDFETDTQTPFDELVQRCRFYKCNVAEQIAMGRTTSPSTLEWWDKQSEHAKKVSFIPSEEDESAHTVIHQMKALVHPRNSFFWQRGSLDQVCLESLCRTYNEKPVINYWMYRDVRTAINVLGRDCNEQVSISGFVKHDPVHDCAADVIMLLKG